MFAQIMVVHNSVKKINALQIYKYALDKFKCELVLLSWKFYFIFQLQVLKI